MVAFLAQLHSSKAPWIELLGIPVGVLWTIFGAQDAASQYKPQEAVTVWVNPRNPKNTVLEPVPQLLLSLFHTGLGIFVVWVSLSKTLG